MKRKISLSTTITLILLTMALTVSLTMLLAMRHFNDQLKMVGERQEMYTHVHDVDSVVREYYPEPWLRTSCDIDILVHKEDLNKAMAVLLENGCTMYGEKNYHDVSFVTPGKKLLELHFCLREDIPILDRVLDRVWQYTKNAPGKQYEYRLQNGFLLFYLIAHMAFHCRFGGCGIRSFVDIWLLCDRMEYDKELFGQLCCEAKLEQFFDNVQRLIGVWFAGEEHTAVTKQLESIVISGGTYGSLDNRILIDQAQTGGKRKQFWQQKSE